MSELLEILNPSYVLRNALYGGVITGMVLPLIGILMYARRMIFLGVTLPQLSATGIAVAIFWHLTFHEQTPIHSDFLMALLGSTVLTTGTLVFLSALERRGRGLVEGRIGAVYILAGAVTILLLASERIPEVGVIQLLRGQIIAISDADMVVLLISFSLVGVMLWLFRKELLLVSVDRDLALSMGKKVWAWDLLLYALAGLTISLGVLMVGPLLTFAFVLLPPMMFQVVPVMAVLLGAFIAFSGFIVSYEFDWPTGPTDALIACILLGLVTVSQWLGCRFRSMER
jgi:ABC-type Mn2+/Zn2+ transport system permease subunit